MEVLKVMLKPSSHAQAGAGARMGTQIFMILRCNEGGRAKCPAKPILVRATVIVGCECHIPPFVTKCFLQVETKHQIQHMHGPSGVEKRVVVNVKPILRFPNVL